MAKPRPKANPAAVRQISNGSAWRRRPEPLGEHFVVRFDSGLLILKITGHIYDEFGFRRRALDGSVGEPGPIKALGSYAFSDKDQAFIDDMLKGAGLQINANEC